jgi:hypothetical protein
MKSGHLSTNGLRMYHEIHGEGQPLVLLHGALSATGSSHTMMVDRAEMLLPMLKAFLDPPAKSSSLPLAGRVREGSQPT